MFHTDKLFGMKNPMFLKNTGTNILIFKYKN